MGAGWTCVPSVVLERQQALGLEPLDVNILMHLWSFWWFADNPPRPALAEIADRMGVSRSTIQRRLKRMEKDGLIEIEERFDPEKRGKGQLPNAYTFKGLIKASEPLAQEKIDEKQKREQTEAARSRRKPAKRVASGDRS